MPNNIIQPTIATLEMMFSSIERKFREFSASLRDIANLQPTNLGKSSRLEDDEYFHFTSDLVREMTGAMTDVTVPPEVIKLAREGHVREMIVQDNSVRYHCSRRHSMRVCSNNARRVSKDFRLIYEVAT